MKWFYFAVTGSKAYKDQLGVFKTFFENEGHFTMGFVYTLIIAVVLCFIYYLATRASRDFAKLWTWFLTLFIAAVISFGVSAAQCAIGSTNDGLRHTLQVQTKKKTAAGGDATEIQKQKIKMVQEFNKGYFSAKPVDAYCWTNFIVGGFLFFVISIPVKYIGGYGRNIPF